MNTSEIVLEDIFLRTVNDDETILFAKALGLIPEQVACDQGSCDLAMIFVRENSSLDGYILKCPRKDCNREWSVRKNTVFEGSDLKIGTIIRLIYFWAFELHSHKLLEHELKINSSDIVVNWQNNLRDVCAEYYLRFQNRKIGGPNEVVEIDECLLVRRKAEAHDMEYKQWVIVGYQIGSQKAFLEAVPDKSAETLLIAIIHNIRPGTIVMSDCWSSYGGIEEIKVHYNRLAVNKNITLVGRVIGGPTNNNECLRQKMKLKHRRKYGENSPQPETYMVEYIWRCEFGHDPFLFIIKHIQEKYPL